MDIQRLLKELPNLKISLAGSPQNAAYYGTIDEQVYDTLNCTMTPECRLPWVEEIFVPGHPYFETYCKARDAYARLLLRLGGGEEDPDAEDIFYYLQQHESIAAAQMFEYGRIYEKEHQQNPEQFTPGFQTVKR